MTSTYRKRPIPVRALQLTADSYRQILDALTADQFAAGGEKTDGTVFVEVRSLEGVMHASEDDWIVWGNHGDAWVVRGSIFAETYEPVYAEEASAEERIARRLAAGDYRVPGDEPDDAWWNNRPPRFRQDYLAHARHVIALVRAEDQLAATARAAVLREAAAAIEAGQAREEATEWAQQGELDPETEAGGAAVRAMAGLLRRMAADARAAVPAEEAARPRCPHCQMPHDLTPGTVPVAMCESVRQRIAKAGGLHAEGDHSLCTRSDWDVLRDRTAQDGAQPS